MYVVDSGSDEPIMLINQHIGFDSQMGFGIMGDEFQAELLYLDTLGKKRIQVWINSPGGVVLDGMSIYNAILKSKTKVDTYCVGIAASIAAVIFQAGRKRIMSDYGRLMYHNPSGGDDAKSIDEIRQSIVTMIASRSGHADADIAAMMSKETWIDANEAFTAGLCDQVENSGDMNKPRQSSSNDVQTMWSDANKIVNSILKIDTMNKIAALLGLPEDASDETIMNAITDALAKIKAKPAPSDDDNKLTKAITDMINDTKQTVAGIVESMKKDIDGVTNRLNAAEESEKKTRALQMVTDQIKRIGATFGDDVRDEWVKRATADFDGTKKLLDEIPVNKTAVDISQTTNKLNAGEMPTSAMTLMARTIANIKKNGYSNI